MCDKIGAMVCGITETIRRNKMAKRKISEKWERSESQERRGKQPPFLKPEHLNSKASMVEKSELSARLIEHYDGIFHDETIHERLFEGSGYSNFGYWNEGTSSPREASDNLVDRLLEKAPGKAGRVLDVGCGAGGTTRRLAERFGTSNVTAINISSYQLERTSKAAPGVNTLLMSATNLSFDPASFDAIVCVEAAFHFDTRAQFFRQAYRVLKPGGHLILSDVLLFASEVLAVSSAIGIPVANLGSASTYEHQLSLTGFEVATIESARKSTWESFFKYVATRGFEELNGISADIADRRKEQFELLDAWDKLIQDYILVSARKPTTAPPESR
jgi:cyclopropane fatty-acyl-phospholipid synthase-like methyltransferase